MFILVGNSEQTECPEAGQALEMQLGENWRASGTVLAAVHYQQQLWVQIVLNKEIEADTLFRFNDTLLKICELPYTLEEA